MTPRRLAEDYPATFRYLVVLTLIVFVLAVLQVSCR